MGLFKIIDPEGESGLVRRGGEDGEVNVWVVPGAFMMLVVFTVFEGDSKSVAVEADAVIIVADGQSYETGTTGSHPDQFSTLG